MILLFIFTSAIQALSALKTTDGTIREWFEANNNWSDVKLNDLETRVQRYDVKLEIFNNVKGPPKEFMGEVCIEVEQWVMPRDTPFNGGMLPIILERKQGLILQSFETRCKDVTPGANPEKEPVREEHKYPDEVELRLATPICVNNKVVVCSNFIGQFTEENGFSTWHKDGKYVIAAYSERLPIFPYIKQQSAEYFINISWFKQEKLHYLGLDETENTNSSLIVKPAKKLPPSHIAFAFTNLDTLSGRAEVPYIKLFTDFQHLNENALVQKLSSDDYIKPFINQTGFIVMPRNLEGASKWRLSVLSEKDTNHTENFKLIYRKFIQLVFGGTISIPDDWIVEGLASFLISEHAQDIKASYMWTRRSVIEHGLFTYPDEIQTKGAVRGYVVWRMMYLSMGHDNFIESMKKVVSKVVKLETNVDYPDVLSGNFGNLTSSHSGSTIHASLLAANYFKYKSYPVVNVAEKTGTEQGYVLAQLFTTKDLDIFGKLDLNYIDGHSSISEGDTCWELYTPYAVFNKSSGELLENNEKNWMGCELDRITGRTSAIKVDSPAEKVLFLNYKCVGIYRVQYEETFWLNIVEFLKSHGRNVDRDSRACIVHDALVLAWGGVISYTRVFDLLEYLKQEEDVYVWEAFFSGATDLSEILQYSQLYNRFQTFVNSLIKDKFTQMYQDYVNLIDNRKEGTDLSRVGNYFYEWACVIGRIQECITGAIAKFDSWMALGRPHFKRNFDKDLSLALMQTIFCTAVSEKGNDLNKFGKRVDFVIGLVKTDSGHTGYLEHYINSLKCVDHDEKIRSLLNWTNGTHKNDHDLNIRKNKVVKSLAEGKYTYTQTFDFYGSQRSKGPRSPSFIRWIGPRLNESQYQQFQESVLRGHCEECRERIREVTKLRNQIRWLLAQHEPTIESCLEGN